VNIGHIHGDIERSTRAGFGGSNGAADGLNTGLANADMSQQPLLTTPPS
jgi:hypothetical protein